VELIVKNCELTWKQQDEFTIIGLRRTRRVSLWKKIWLEERLYSSSSRSPMHKSTSTMPFSCWKKPPKAILYLHMYSPCVPLTIQSQLIQGGVSKWLLVTQFCAAHDLPLSSGHLCELAEQNEWITFLYEAETQQFPPQQILHIVENYFTDHSLQASSFHNAFPSISNTE
jgi:hypothetical protein